MNIYDAVEIGPPKPSSGEEEVRIHGVIHRLGIMCTEFEF